MAARPHIETGDRKGNQVAGAVVDATVSGDGRTTQHTEVHSVTDHMQDWGEQSKQNALGATATRTFCESGDEHVESSGYRSALSSFELDGSPPVDRPIDAPEPPTVAAVVTPPRPAPARAESKPGAFAWLGRWWRRLLG